MLSEEKEKNINIFIDKITKKIEKNIPEINQPLSEDDKDILNRMIILESKSLFHTLYRDMESKTLEKDLYKNEENKTKYFKLELNQKMKEKFVFETPKHIDYKNGEELKKALMQSGVIFVAGGAVSLITKSSIPVSIGLILSGVWYYTSQQKAKDFEKRKMKEIKDKYLDNLKISLEKWVRSIEEYYVGEVEKLERELKNGE